MGAQKTANAGRLGVEGFHRPGRRIRALGFGAGGGISCGVAAGDCVEPCHALF